MQLRFLTLQIAIYHGQLHMAGIQPVMVKLLLCAYNLHIIRGGCFLHICTYAQLLPHHFRNFSKSPYAMETVAVFTLG